MGVDLAMHDFKNKHGQPDETITVKPYHVTAVLLNPGQFIQGMPSSQLSIIQGLQSKWLNSQDKPNLNLLTKKKKKT